MRIGTKEQLVRFSFCRLLEPHPDMDKKLKYSVQVVIPKTYTEIIKNVKMAISRAVKKGIEKKMFTEEMTTKPMFWACLRDGDQKASDVIGGTQDYLKDCMFFTAKSAEISPPFVVDRYLKPITNRDVIYSGCYGIAEINFYPFPSGKGGIAAGLNGVMKREEGDRLDGSATVNAFGDLKETEDTGPSEGGSMFSDLM